MNPETIDRIHRNWDKIPAHVQDRLSRAGLGPDSSVTTTPAAGAPTSVTTTPTLGNEAQARPPAAGVAGDVLRIGGMLTGGAIGGALIPGVGAPAGAAIGAAGMDLLAQGQDVMAGQQESINPALTAVEAGAAALPIVGKTIKTAALGAGILGAGTDIARRLAQGKPLELDGELMLATGGSALLGGVARSFQNRLMLGQSVQQLTGDNEVVRAVDDIMTKPQAKRSFAETQRVARELGINPEQVGKTGSMSFDDPVEFVKNELSDLPSVAKKFPKGVKKGETAPATSFTRHFFPEETSMNSLQQQTGYPVYEDYTTLINKFKLHKTAINEYADRLQKIFRGTTATKRAVWSAALDTQDAKSIATLGLSPRDERAVRELGSVLSDVEQKFGGNYREFTATMPDNPEAITRATSFLRRSSFNYYLKEDWDAAFNKYKNVKNVDVQSQMLRVLNAMQGNPDWMSTKITMALNKALGKMGISGVDARSVANEVTAINYSGALGGRMGPVIRNTLQPIQTAYPYLGERWTAHGLRAIMSSNKRAEAIASGVTRGQALDIADVEAIAANPLRRGLKFVVEKSLWPFQKVEEYVRGWTYLAQRDKTLWAAAKAKGDVNKFMDLSDIDRFQEGPRARILAAYATGDINQAADEAGKHLVTLTQFDYTAAARPKLLTEYGPAGLGGRVAGSFGTWSASYGAYLADSFVPGRAQGSVYKKGRDVIRWLAGNTAIAATYTSIGHTLNDQDAGQDVLGWTFIAPLVFGGGPAATAFMAAGALLSKAAQGKVSERDLAQSKRELIRSTKTFVPGSLAYDEFRKAGQEPTTAEAVGRLTGFKRGK